MNRVLFSAAAAVLACCGIACAGQRWSVRVADSFLKSHPGAVFTDSVNTNSRWNYEQGFMLLALLRLSERTGDSSYARFAQKNLDQFVSLNGSIATYKKSDYKLDDIGPGRALLTLSRATWEKRYSVAADSLRSQIASQPRIPEGGFWHKQIYPNQMWLDGLFMAAPFYSAYTAKNGPETAWDDIANQILLMESHLRDSSTGLLYHGWDESRTERWADRLTGRSSSFWGRAMGWYGMGIIDVLEYFPKNHPRRNEIVSALRRLAAALKNYQDPASGLWYQLVDQGAHEGNYLESSATAMFAYVFAKGARLGYLEPEYRSSADRAFQGLCESMLVAEQNGTVSLTGTCKSAGLGGKPYRDGSAAYYYGERARTNDLKGLAAFLFAGIELEFGTH